MTPCETCGRLPLHLHPEAADALRASIKRDRFERLHRAESVVSGCNEEERLGIAAWLGGMLRRPPLDKPSPAWDAMRALVEALWWDLHDVTPDPLDPDVPHPRLAASHPWGDRDEG